MSNNQFEFELQKNEPHVGCMGCNCVLYIRFNGFMGMINTGLDKTTNDLLVLGV
jgi:hypothetical protein